jgi:hypothetical protein
MGAADRRVLSARLSLAVVTIRPSGNRLLIRYRSDRHLPTLAALATVGFTVGLLIDDQSRRWLDSPA